VRTAPPYILGSPPSIFDVGLNLTVSPVTHQAQLFHHIQPMRSSGRRSPDPESLSSHTQPVRPSGDVHRLSRHHVTPEIFLISRPSARIPLVRVCSGIRSSPLYPRVGVLPGHRSNRAQPTKSLRPNSTQRTSLMGEDCPTLYIGPLPSISDVGLYLTWVAGSRPVELERHLRESRRTGC